MITGAVIALLGGFVVLLALAWWATRARIAWPIWPLIAFHFGFCLASWHFPKNEVLPFWASIPLSFLIIVAVTGTLRLAYAEFKE